MGWERDRVEWYLFLEQIDMILSIVESEVLDWYG